MQVNKPLSVEEQERIAAAGAACAGHTPKSGWTLNPYVQGTDEYDIWLGGYEAECERQGSEGRNW